MFENKFTTIVICVCVSFQFFFTLAKVHKESHSMRNVSDSRVNRRLLRRITKVLREERHFLPNSHHKELAEDLATRTPQRPHLPKYMLDLYKSAKDIEDSVIEMDVQWKRNSLQGDIRPLIKGMLPKWQYHVKFIWAYSFNRSSLPEKIYDSELVLNLQHHHHRHCHFTDLRLHTASSHLSLPKMHFKDNNLVMNVTDIVKNATNFKTEDFILRIISPRIRRQSCLSNTTSVLLVIYTGISIKSIQKASIHRKHQLSRTLVGRQRRSSDNSSSLQEMPFQRENYTVNNITVCHMKPWEVKFSDIQWNLIKYPTNYSASYCTGRCNGLMDSRISNHAFLRNKYHMATRYQNSHIPSSCCLPSLLSPLTVLYLNTKKEVEVGMLPNMVVRNCSCL